MINESLRLELSGFFWPVCDITCKEFVCRLDKEVVNVCLRWYHSFRETGDVTQSRDLAMQDWLKENELVNDTEVEE